MSKEDYVSLEVAKLLKEKGFNEYCGAYYHLNWDDMNEEECFEVAPNHDFRNKDNGYRAGAPTLYEAAKFLRKKGIFIEIIPHYSNKYDVIEYEYRIATYFDLLGKQGKRRKSKEYYLKYEQCLDNAIIDSLKNQEIFKNSKSE